MATNCVLGRPSPCDVPKSKLERGRLEAFLFIQNLFDTKWEQATFAFESQLRNEAAPANDIHFVPGTPRMFMGGMAWYFERD